jgi:DNA mismatch repair protein MutS2
VELFEKIPSPLPDWSARALQWEDLLEQIARRVQSPLGRARVTSLVASSDTAWIDLQQSRNEEMQRLMAGGSFDLRGIFDVTEVIDRARIEGAALEALELRSLITHAERIDAWRERVLLAPEDVRSQWPAMAGLTAPLAAFDLSTLLRTLRGKIEPDGSLSDDASPELGRIRRSMAQQHRAIEASLRRALSRLSEDGSTQDALITVRGERFVIPVKAEFKRRVNGVVHGSSSSGQTVFVEPLETIEHNNELTRLLDEEQAEVHRILVAMTRAVAANAEAMLIGAAVLARVDAHQAIAAFALEFECVRPSFVAASSQDFSVEDPLSLVAARHPLLEIRLRSQDAAIVPLTITLPTDESHIAKRQMIISGPNTGGKTVALKTAGLLAAMAQAGLPVPATRARLPLFDAIYADIGDAQSIEQNLSTFSAHVVNVNRIALAATASSLVLLDELGSATDPEEGAALAVAVAEHFLHRKAWTFISTHLTALKVYAAQHDGVLNAAAGFDEATLAPTYELRLGVPGASAGLNIAARLGLDAAIVDRARGHQTTQQVEIARFIDALHAQLAAAAAEREQLAAAQREINRERQRLEHEGRAEQQARTRELERQLKLLIEDFEAQIRDAVKAIGDKTVAQKMARDSALRIAQLKREFSAQFQSTVTAHTTPTAAGASSSKRHREPRVGDLVLLKSLKREGRIDRIVDTKTLEVTIGSMKTRVPRSDIAEIISSAESSSSAKRRGGVNLASADTDSMTSEINVIGRTADEAEGEVDRFVERAYMAGLPRIRVVHGVGMGILRRTLREFLRNHPYVTGVAEPPYNEGGQGATIVDLRQ